MKFVSIISEILLNEYNQKLVDQLIVKFKAEDPDLSNDMIKLYINRFTQIKDSPKVSQKDVTKYSWKELETTVDTNQSQKRVKAGKLDPTAEDANMVYNKDGIRVYVGTTREACIKYGNGYSFCISARGGGFEYKHYRYDKQGTPYFVFNDNLPKDNPSHILVIFYYKKRKEKKTTYTSGEGTYKFPELYTVTDANNDGDVEYPNFKKIIEKYPWVKPLQEVIQHKDTDPLEKEELQITNKYYWDIQDTKDEYSNKMRKEGAPSWAILNSYDEDYLPIINGEKKIKLLMIKPGAKEPTKRPEGYETWEEGKKKNFNMMLKFAGSALAKAKNIEYKIDEDDDIEESKDDIVKTIVVKTIMPYEDFLTPFIKKYNQLKDLNLFKTIYNFIYKLFTEVDVTDKVIEFNKYNYTYLETMSELEAEKNSKISKFRLAHHKK